MRKGTCLVRLIFANGLLSVVSVSFERFIDKSPNPPPRRAPPTLCFQNVGRATHLGVHSSQKKYCIFCANNLLIDKLQIL